jgi:hypothetical protein
LSHLIVCFKASNMKRLIPSPETVISSFFLLIFCFIIKKRRKTGIIYLLFIVILNLGCFQSFYHTNSKKTISDSTMLKLQAQEKNFTVYLANGNYSLRNIKINNNIIEADVEHITGDQSKYLLPQHKSNRYKKKDEQIVLNEVQIYALSEKLQDSTHLSLPISSITRVDVFSKDKERTSASHVASGIGVGVGVVGVIALIACNCPQVYAYDGNDYQFKAGLFSGAIYSSLEKTDYLPLDKLVSVNGKYKFRVMNNQLEEQNINRVLLTKIHHDAQTNVLLDRNGRIHTFQNPVLPISTSLTNDETGQTFKNRDGNTYWFNQKHDSTSVFGSVILTFEKQAGAGQAKLIVNAKNSLWAGYIFEDFTSLFGEKFQKYQSMQDKANKEKLDRWQKEQALSMMVYIETEKGWQLIDYFPTTGNTAGRDMIMPLNLPPSKENKIRIKLESAFMFWELDYIGMDFSTDKTLESRFVPASYAIKSNSSVSELASLASNDNEYCKLLQNEFLSIEFDGQASTQEDSYFLVSTGYYHSLKQYEGNPDIGMLKQFKKKGFFSEFSEQRFNEAQQLLAKGIDLSRDSLHN